MGRVERSIFNGKYFFISGRLSIKLDDLVKKMGRLGEKWDDFTGGLLPTMWVSELRAFPSRQCTLFFIMIQ